MYSPTVSKKLRIICLSDTHNSTPHLPPGDIIIHAGDISNRGGPAEINAQLSWLLGPRGASYKQRIVIAGNHDLVLDAAFCAKNEALLEKKFGGGWRDDVARLREMLAREVTYLADEHCQVEVQNEKIGVYGCPWSRNIEGQEAKWAFGYADGEQAEAVFARLVDMKEKINILVVHGPPKGLCDVNHENKSDGCEALLTAISRVRPKLVVCGHRHEGRGCMLVEWVGSHGCEMKRVWKWVDPAAEDKKLSLVDLTGKKGKWMLVRKQLEETRLKHNFGEAEDIGPGQPHEEVDDTLQVPAMLRDQASQWTCVVNAAVMVHSYGGPKGLNKPIAVDIDLTIIKSN